MEDQQIGEEGCVGGSKETEIQTFCRDDGFTDRGPRGVQEKDRSDQRETNQGCRPQRYLHIVFGVIDFTDSFEAMGDETCPAEAKQEEEGWEGKKQMAEVVIVVLDDLIDSSPDDKAQGSKPITEDE